MLTADQLDELNNILDIVRPGAPLADSPIHGEHHWQTVSLIGAQLASDTPGANVRVALLFGAIHDSRRENDHHDPEHGLRAAELLSALHANGQLTMEPALLARLQEAVARHDDGGTTLDPAIGVCWDADRLCLPRIGIEPDVDRLSTRAGRTHRAWAKSLQHVASVDWAKLTGRARSEAEPKPEAPRDDTAISILLYLRRASSLRS